MTEPSGINPQTLEAAHESTRKAMDAMDAIVDEWMLREKARPAATRLKSINDHLRRLASMLDDPAADHYAMAHDFGLIVAQLMLMDDFRLVRPIFDISTAMHKITSTRN